VEDESINIELDVSAMIARLDALLLQSASLAAKHRDVLDKADDLIARIEVLCAAFDKTPAH
jgi:hypothetical protein